MWCQRGNKRALCLSAAVIISLKMLCWWRERLMKYRRSLACAQEQICILRAWAVTLMFYTVQIWQRLSQETLFGGKMLTVPGQQARKIIESAHAHRRTRMPSCHTLWGRKSIFCWLDCQFPPRGHVHHNSRFLTKLRSALNRAASEGRGDDNDVYEVEINDVRFLLYRYKSRPVERFCRDQMWKVFFAISAGICQTVWQDGGRASTCVPFKGRRLEETPSYNQCSQL